MSFSINRVLVPTDGSPCAKGAEGMGVRVAEAFGADLVRLRVSEAHHGRGKHRLESVETARTETTEGPNGHPWTNVEVHGPSAATSIVQYADARDVDLIVMGTHGRSGVRRVLLGSTTEGVIRRAPCPVLAVPKGAGDVQLDPILVPTDLSPHSRAAFPIAATVAAAANAPVHTVHVVEDVVLPDAYGIDPVPVATPDVVARARETLEALSRDALGDRLAEAHIESGPAAETILETARILNAGLLVLATRGRTGLKRWLLGSVAETVIHGAECPVLTVRDA